ncbi:MAG: AraC family transcriptional regulator [Myxococcales bacterium]|nr:AraC family transcriptional regulator [Myxococcales bacterium]
MTKRKGADELAETQELADLIERRTEGRDAALTVRPGLLFARTSESRPKIKALYRCALCVVVRGQKLVHVGNQAYRYDRRRYLVSTLTVPTECDLVVDPQEGRLLSLALELDLRRIGKLIAEAGDDLEPMPSPAPAAMVSAPFDRAMARALLRLAEIAGSDAEWRLLGDTAIREVHYRALVGPAGPYLRERVARSSSIEPVARAVRYIEENLADRLDVASIAKAAAVSSSGLHTRFKEVTAQSPMQFVKRLRLEHARGLIASGNSVTDAAFRVGYVSPSQFSRDFRRHFGVPPSKTRPLDAAAG